VKKNGLVTSYLIFVRVLRRTYHKRKSRYKHKRIEGLSDTEITDISRIHNMKYKRVISEVEETIIDLRLTNPRLSV